MERELAETIGALSTWCLLGRDRSHLPRYAPSTSPRAGSISLGLDVHDCSRLEPGQRGRRVGDRRHCLGEALLDRLVEHGWVFGRFHTIDPKLSLATPRVDDGAPVALNPLSRLAAALRDHDYVDRHVVEGWRR
jgi:hypothetical protein